MGKYYCDYCGRFEAFGDGFRTTYVLNADLIASNFLLLPDVFLVSERYDEVLSGCQSFTRNQSILLRFWVVHQFEKHITVEEIISRTFEIITLVSLLQIRCDIFLKIKLILCLCKVWFAHRFLLPPVHILNRLIISPRTR